MKNDIKLGALFYPKESGGRDISFESLYIPYIYKEIYFDGIYIDVLNQQKDMTIIDVGANCGVVTQHLRNHAKKVYAIEPSPEHFEALKKNKEFNEWDNVEVFNLALADKDGEMEFSQNSFNRTMNTLVIGETLPDGRYKVVGKDLSMGTAMPYEPKIKVKTMSFDTFMEQNNIDEVDFCKFDVEGAEDMILRSEGFKKVAPRIKQIEVEMHYPDWIKLVEYMATLGYQARRYQCSAIVIMFFR